MHSTNNTDLKNSNILKCNFCYVKNGLYILNCSCLYCSSCLKHSFKIKSSICRVCEKNYDLLKTIDLTKKENYNKYQHLFLDPDMLIKKGLEVLQFHKNYNKKYINHLKLKNLNNNLNENHESINCDIIRKKSNDNKNYTTLNNLVNNNREDKFSDNSRNLSNYNYNVNMKNNKFIESKYVNSTSSNYPITSTLSNTKKLNLNAMNIKKVSPKNDTNISLMNISSSNANKNYENKRLKLNNINIKGIENINKNGKINLDIEKYAHYSNHNDNNFVPQINKNQEEKFNKVKSSNNESNNYNMYKTPLNMINRHKGFANYYKKD